MPAACTAVVGVIGVAALLAVLVSPGVLAVPVNGPGWVQVTVWPLVVQLHGPLVKLAGALVPAGSVIVAVIVPVVGPVPMLVTVMGTVLATPATKAGDGWP